MVVREIPTKEFYLTLKKWSESHEFPVLSIELLPEFVWICAIDFPQDDNITCLGMVYSIFVYPSPPIAWLAYPMSNPEVPYKHRKGGLGFLINEVSNQLKGRGVKQIFTTSSNDRVKQSLENCGYQKGDELTTHYFKMIWEQNQQQYKPPPSREQLSGGLVILPRDL